ncbi:Rib/alpha-like domain-containing protein, partial [Streptococcus suis]
DTTTPGDKPVTVVVTYPDGSKDEVPSKVTVTPQKDKYEPTPKVQEVPQDGTPTAEGSIGNIPELPANTKITWKPGGDPNTTTPGEKDGIVLVTYPDGSQDEVPVKVNVTPKKETPKQADEFTPTPKDQTVDNGAQPDPKLNIENPDGLPEGTTFEYKTPVDTTTPGEKSVTVVVTYPDGSKDEVPSKVTVTPQKDKYEPTPKVQEVPQDSTPTAEGSIGNIPELPANTKITWKPGGEPNTSTPGEKDGIVLVTYPDGSQDEVPVKVNVTPKKETPKQADEFTPTPKDQTVDNGAQPDPKLNIENPDGLPEGTTFEYKTPVDTTTPGDKPVTVVVTYPDGSKDEVPSKVTVTPQKDKYEPTPKDQEVPQDGTPTAEGSISNIPELPANTKITWKPGGEPNTSTPGEKDGTVLVTYPDGSTDEVPVKVNVTPKKETPKQADEFTPTPKDQTVDNGAQPDPKLNIENPDGLPEGT